MNQRNKLPRALWLLPVASVVGTGAFMLWRGTISGERQTTETVEPGITLTTIERNTPRPLRMFVVRTDFKQGWRLRPVLADGSADEPGAALRRTSVSHQLAAYNRVHKSDAPVAINGGFFAYEGGAVGAVKLNNQWIRLPWKNRTAIGFNEAGKARIGNLKGTARVAFEDGTIIPIAALNGFPVKNAVTVLTRDFAASYKLKPDETALDIGEGEVLARIDTPGEKVSLEVMGPQSFLMVANGSARPLIAKTQLLQTARFEVVTTAGEWQDYPTILGAGPRLVRNGQVHSTEVEEVFRPDVTQRGPRTAIGIDKAGNYFIVVVESGVQNGTGLTLPELAQEMQAMGAVDAINLDGGASVALVVKGKVITPQAPEVPVANSVLVVREK